MSGAEMLALIRITLAVPGVIDVFTQVGQGVALKISKDKKAKEYASDLHLFVIPSGIERMQLQMRRAQNLLKDPIVEEADKDRLISIFNNMKSALTMMDDSANLILAPGTIFGNKRRTALHKLKTETARFRELFDDFGDRILALKDLAASSSDMFLTEHDFQWIFSSLSPRILNSNAFIRKGRLSRDLKNVKKSEVRWFLYEQKPYTTRNKTTMESNIRTLSQKLDAADKGDPGILPVLGFRDETDEEAFQLLFIIPEVGQNCQTLLSAFHSVREVPSLNTRIDICFQLAEAILHVHNVRLVHKSIRPDNVIVFGPLDGNGKPTDEADGMPKLKIFLSGWHLARPADDFDTRREGEKLWQRRVYQHPQRQPREAEADYNMGHDIYSLGVCMLETLRWESLVTQEQPEIGVLTSELSPDYARTFEFLDLHNEGRIRPSFISDMDWMLQEPRNAQKVVLALSNKHLPRTAGTRLTALVSHCLTRLDADMSSAEGVLLNTDCPGEVGNSFVDFVLKPLREISYALGT